MADSKAETSVQSRWNEHEVLAAAGAPLHSLPKRFQGGPMDQPDENTERRENCRDYQDDPHVRAACNEAAN